MTHRGAVRLGLHSKGRCHPPRSAVLGGQGQMGTSHVMTQAALEQHGSGVGGIEAGWETSSIPWPHSWNTSARWHLLGRCCQYNVTWDLELASEEPRAGFKQWLYPQGQALQPMLKMEFLKIRFSFQGLGDYLTPPRPSTSHRPPSLQSGLHSCQQPGRKWPNPLSPEDPREMGFVGS
ncbi:hypothetical protein KIL84_015172 [Mauremys mutica]|uniref:Uncharacterized protein n=1 Tax=Mauremys mutica TaxID=74926 RepID=A0A9D3WSN1_9SAUR|nr:hypothetical protein KIL84_015172 [Mauremys mutica]